CIHVERGDPWLAVAWARVRAGAADFRPPALQHGLVPDPRPQELPLALGRGEALQAACLPCAEGSRSHGDLVMRPAGDLDIDSHRARLREGVERESTRVR